MKNSLIILITSIITLWAFGFKTSKPIALNKLKPSVRIDTLKNKLDSLEEYKTKLLNTYATEIEISYETIKNEKNKQEKLNMSIDSILDLVSTNDSLNKKINLTKN